MLVTTGGLDVGLVRPPLAAPGLDLDWVEPSRASPPTVHGLEELIAGQSWIQLLPIPGDADLAAFVVRDT